MSRSTIVVAGGAGFIGSHLCDALLARGDRVVCVDNLLTGRFGNLAHVESHERFTFVQRDVAALGRGDLVDAGVDVDDLAAIAHLASPASPKDYLRLPLETLDAGSRGTSTLLALAEASGARFVLGSTSEVYGDPAEHPQRETYWGNVNPIGERSVYDEAKRFAEAITSAHRRCYGVDTGIVRIFNTYGPRLKLDDGRVVSNFIAQALRGDPLTVYGDGSQTRSLCYVDDLVRGLIAMIDADDAGPFNLGNPTELTMIELARVVLDVTESSSNLVFHPLPSDDPRRRRPDISLATSALGWRPEISVIDGLTATVEAIRVEVGV